MSGCICPPHQKTIYGMVGKIRIWPKQCSNVAIDRLKEKRSSYYRVLKQLICIRRNVMGTFFFRGASANRKKTEKNSTIGRHRICVQFVAWQGSESLVLVIETRPERKRQKKMMEKKGASIDPVVGRLTPSNTHTHDGQAGQVNKTSQRKGQHEENSRNTRGQPDHEEIPPPKSEVPPRLLLPPPFSFLPCRRFNRTLFPISKPHVETGHSSMSVVDTSPYLIAFFGDKEEITGKKSLTKKQKKDKIQMTTRVNGELILFSLSLSYKSLDFFCC